MTGRRLIDRRINCINNLSPSRLPRVSGLNQDDNYRGSYPVFMLLDHASTRSRLVQFHQLSSVTVVLGEIKYGLVH
jgi:hypothetical protein